MFAIANTRTPRKVQRETFMSIKELYMNIESSTFDVKVKSFKI